jgi:hypothetical protein
VENSSAVVALVGKASIWSSSASIEATCAARSPASSPPPRPPPPPPQPVAIRMSAPARTTLFELDASAECAGL